MGRFGSFLIGGLLGATIALLLAPRSGEETRAMVGERLNNAWDDAQKFGNQAAGNMQQAYQNVSARGQEFAQDFATKSQSFAHDVATKGQEFYEQASARMQEAANSVAPAFSEKGDELHDKIESARQRIASQMAQNAEADDKSASVTIPVDAVDEAAKDAADK